MVKCEVNYLSITSPNLAWPFNQLSPAEPSPAAQQWYWLITVNLVGKKMLVLFSLQCCLQSEENSTVKPISLIWLWFTLKRLLLGFILSVLHILRMYWKYKRIVFFEPHTRSCIQGSEDMKSLFVTIYPWSSATLSTLFHPCRRRPGPPPCSGWAIGRNILWDCDSAGSSVALKMSQTVTALRVPNWPSSQAWPHGQYTTGRAPAGIAAPGPEYSNHTPNPAPHCYSP